MNDPDWQALDANCLGVKGFTEMHVKLQAEYCALCPARAECADYGTNEQAWIPDWNSLSRNKTDDHLYGGLNSQQRRTLREARR